MKHPPVQMVDSEASRLIEAFLEGRDEAEGS